MLSSTPYFSIAARVSPPPASENARLRAMLGFQQNARWKIKPARVIARDPANWWRNVQIDLGERDGLRVDLAKRRASRAGVVICLTAALTPIMKLEEMVNVGTLMAFAIVCLGILVLRRARPDLPRPFRTPWLPVVSNLAVKSVTAFSPGP